jgi:hypothetical protein
VPAAPQALPGPAGRVGLGEVAGRARTVTLAGARVLPVLPALAGLFPDGGLRRGSVIAVSPGGDGGCRQAGTSLAAALLAGVTATGTGSWGGVTGPGVRALGLAGLAEMGADLSRLALVDSPARDLPATISTLLDAVDVVLVVAAAGERVRPGDARRLAARARERGSVLVLREQGTPWPVPADLYLRPLAAEWRGLGQGHGRLTGRVVQVELTGRGAAARPRRCWSWLPAADGSVRPVGPGQVVEDVAGGADEDAVPGELAGAG